VCVFFILKTSKQKRIFQRSRWFCIDADGGCDVNAGVDDSGDMMIILSMISYCTFFKLYLFYNYYETSYTTFNHARWHRCLRPDSLRVGGNRSARRNPTCLTWYLLVYCLVPLSTALIHVIDEFKNMNKVAFYWTRAITDFWKDNECKSLWQKKIAKRIKY